MLNSIQLFATDKLPCNHGNYHLVIIYWPRNHVYFVMSCTYMKVILIKMHPYRVSIRLITCTSPLTAITFCQVSPNPMAVPKPILLHLKGRPQSKKIIQIKTFIFESKGQSTPVMTFDPNFMGYI